MDSLFIRASTGEIKYLNLNEPARDTLVQMGGKATPYLIGLLETKDARERQTLIDLLKKIKGTAVLPLMEHVEGNPDRESSILAVHILGKIGEEAKPSVPFLIGLLNHPEWRMRLAGCEALGEIGDPRGIEPLATALKDTVFLVRKGAAFGIGKISSDPEKRIPALVEALGDDSYSVRYPAAEALEKIGKPAVPDLMKPLKSGNSFARSLACEILGKIQDRRALSFLKRMLKDEDWGVRLSARSAIDRLEKREGEMPDSPIGGRIETR